MNPVPPTPLELNKVRERILLLLAGRWIALHDLRHEMIIRHDVYMSESALGARVRDLRKAKYGNWPVSTRRVPGKSYMQYRIDI